MLKSLKIPFPSLVKLIEYLGNKKSKLIELNLDKVFSSTGRNKEKLNLTLGQLICSPGYEENKEILEKIKPIDEENKKIYKYLLDIKYKFLLDNFFNNKEKEFEINGEKIKVLQFKTIDEVLEEKYSKYSTESLNEKLARIQNIKTMTKIILDNFEHDWEERKPRMKKEKSIEFKKTEENSNIFTFQLNTGNFHHHLLPQLQKKNIYYDSNLENKEIKENEEENISNE